MMLQQPAIAITSGDKLFSVVSALADRLLSYAIALAAIGALAMALVELYKKIMDSRTKFHAKQFRLWIERTCAPDIDWASALTQLLQLCTGVSQKMARTAVDKLKSGEEPEFFHAFRPKHEYASFALETTQLMAAVQEAADVALASPRDYRDLFDGLTTGANTNDIAIWIASRNTVAPLTPEETRKAAESFARIRQIVVRKLDGFQIYTVARWASWNQFRANILGAIIMAIALWRMIVDGTDISLTLCIVLSVFGGVLAPVAKDLVSALRNVKSA